jgi:tetratricopeptide (TPR) repeat protein
MLRSKITLCWICFAALLSFAPFQVIAFNERLEPRAAPLLLRPEENRKVIILDNDFLDRRFGTSRSSETNVSNSARSAPIERNGFTFGGPQIINIPPRRPADVLPNNSMLKGINRDTPARRAAALRLAETGRTLLRQGQHRKAIYYFEKALSMDASPSFYFYLARAHFQLADYDSSLRFLQVAESGFDGQPEWVTEVAALKDALSGFPSRQATPNRNVAWTFNEY